MKRDTRKDPSRSGRNEPRFSLPPILAETSSTNIIFFYIANVSYSFAVSSRLLQIRRSSKRTSERSVTECMQRLNVFVVHLSAICFAFDKQDDSSNAHYRVLRQMELDTRLINTGERCAFAFLLFVHFSLSLSLTHARAHSEITRTRDNRKDRAAIIDEANGYIPRWKVRDARLDWRKIEKDETWDTSGIAKLRERFSVFNERFSLANDAAGVAYIDSSVVGTKRSK